MSRKTKRTLLSVSSAIILLVGGWFILRSFLLNPKLGSSIQDFSTKFGTPNNPNLQTPNPQYANFDNTSYGNMTVSVFVSPESQSYDPRVVSVRLSLPLDDNANSIKNCSDFEPSDSQILDSYTDSSGMQVMNFSSQSLANNLPATDWTLFSSGYTTGSNPGDFFIRIYPWYGGGCDIQIGRDEIDSGR